jgi:type II secretory pathway component GspD/PulD (secretin)
MLKKIRKIVLCLLMILFTIDNSVLFGESEQDSKYKISVSETSDLPDAGNSDKSTVSAASSGTYKRFAEFKDLLLKSVPENKKDDLKKELEKLSSNKEFLTQLTPEKINQVKKEIDIYKQNKNEGIEENTSGQIPLLGKNDIVTSIINIDEKNITFDFPNVSLAEFTRFVANLNEKILIGDNLLQGNVTLKTPEKISLNELMDVFGALLNSNGLSYIISGDYLQIFQKSDSEVKVYKINYLKSKDVAKTLSDIFKMSFRVGGVPEKVMIDSLDQANSIIVLAPKEKHSEIAQAIKEIDFRRRQVLMEVRVIELTHTDNFGFGGTFAFDYKATSGGMAPNATQYGGAPIPPAFSSDIANPYSGVAYNNGQFMYNLQADKRISKIKILSQPRILTSENQKAEIKVGQEQPVVNAQTNMGVSANDAPIEQTTVDWKDIGIDLKITPRINSKRDVTLDLDLKITSILRKITVGKWDNYPVIGQRIAKNSSTVKDNEILIVGGLLKDEKVTTRKSVPFFGDIPMIGHLFATYEEKTEQTELVILVIPRVIESPADGKIVTEGQIDYFENYNLENKKEIKGMIKGKRDKSWDLFNVYDYFNDEEYKSDQMLIPQKWGGK